MLGTAPGGTLPGVYDPSDPSMAGGQPYADTITPQRLNIYKLPSPQKPYRSDVGAGSPNLHRPPHLALHSTGPGARGGGGSPIRGGIAYQTPSSVREGSGEAGIGNSGHPATATGAYPIAPNKSQRGTNPTLYQEARLRPIHVPATQSLHTPTHHSLLRP